MSEKFTFFWDGPFSQWEESYFELDGEDYNCAEQFMMASKAKLFEDEQTHEMIMAAGDPATQKKLGRLVDCFDVDVWEDEDDNGYPACWNIVWRGNMAKFSQNKWLLDKLLETEGTILVEASPHDCIWGIGLRKSDPAAQDRENWRGRNWLGEVLTSVRSVLEKDPRPYLTSEDGRNLCE